MFVPSTLLHYYLLEHGGDQRTATTVRVVSKVTTLED